MSIITRIENKNVRVATENQLKPPDNPVSPQINLAKHWLASISENTNPCELSLLQRTLPLAKYSFGGSPSFIFSSHQDWVSLAFSAADWGAQNFFKMDQPPLGLPAANILFKNQCVPCCGSLFHQSFPKLRIQSRCTRLWPTYFNRYSGLYCL